MKISIFETASNHSENPPDGDGDFNFTICALVVTIRNRYE